MRPILSCRSNGSSSESIFDVAERSNVGGLSGLPKVASYLLPVTAIGQAYSSRMVQMTKVAEIRQEWIKAGSPECDHPDLDKEYYLGAQTGDFACMRCGETFSDKEARPIRKRNGEVFG